jgi:hypothetical protein
MRKRWNPILSLSGLALLLALLSSQASRAASFPCDEAGILAAIAAGGGPHDFACAGPTTVTVGATLVVPASVTLQGGSLLTISGGNLRQVFSVSGGARLQLWNLTVTQGRSAGAGGCISVAVAGRLDLLESVVSDCDALGGGGGAIASDGMVTLAFSSVTGSSAATEGGGILADGTLLTLAQSSVAGNSAGTSGGGIAVTTGGLTLGDSTVSGNSAPVGGGIAMAATPGSRQITRATFSGNSASDAVTRGGGIRNGSASLLINNSSFAGNIGGAISNAGGLTLEHVTFSGNPAPSETAIFHAAGAPGIEVLRNTILAGSCTPAVRTSQGGNLESPGNGCGLTHASDQVNVSAVALGLGAFGNHGGPTQTVALLPSSAARDAGVACPPPTEDQRGIARPQGAGCDAGAYELSVEVPLGGVGWLAAALAASGALALRRSRMRSPNGSAHGMTLAILLAALWAPGADAAVFDCDEYGVANALGTSGGPHTFSCAGPTTVTISGGYPFGGGSVNAILDGENELTLSGADTNPVLAVGPGQPLELRRMAIVDGQSHGGAGGCIAVASGASLTLVEVTLSGCATWDGIAHNLGGAISNDGALALVDSSVTDSIGSLGSIASGYGSASASLSLTRSRVYANPTSFGFGGIYVAAGGFTLTDSAVEENAGGGLQIAGVGARTISGSSISRNLAIGGSTGFGVSAAQGSLAITNSTLAENGWSGLLVGSASVEVTNSTIAGNGNPAASAISGGSPGNPTLRNTILAGSCSAVTRTSLGGNLESPGNGCNLTHASDQVSVSAAALALGALGDHGGPTDTLPLLPHSAAIGAGVACPPPAADQRGVARPQGAGCDAGAYELDFAVPLGGVAWLAAALLGSGALALRRAARRH